MPSSLDDIKNSIDYCDAFLIGINGYSINMSYYVDIEFLDEVIWRVENLHQSINDMLNDDFLYEKQNKISIEQKQEWLQKFFRRMTTSIYKSFIMPPFPIIDRYSINKFEYKQKYP